MLSGSYGVKVTKYGKVSQLNIIDFFKLLNKLINVTSFFLMKTMRLRK